jgi:AraC family transcriptional regulator, regulatory protein of adaptative response / methylated-DNA-[protein]-cysteine methyltransferase
VESTGDVMKWQAVMDRDPAYDGRFVYAVATTRIYCRPTCPARRPSRDRVRFYETAEQAESAGYRACRRCHPRTEQSPTSERIDLVRRYIDEHLDETVTLQRLAQLANMSPFHLQRVFKKKVGVSPRAYAGARRLEGMKARLRTGVTVSRASFDAGYTSGSRAYEHARSGMGMTPGSYRHGGRGMVISHTVVPTPVGQLLVAATERGLCSVMLGDSAAELEKALRQEYPAATLRTGNGDLEQFTSRVLEQIRGLDTDPVAMDVGGTAFQWQVWDALRRIPAGETRSYRAIAEQLGRPTAARAVARACASNRLALVIPCHRAVHESGELGGYRWGIERKKQILRQERERSSEDIIPAEA